jgi:hypothetical protein
LSIQAKQEKLIAKHARLGLQAEACNHVVMSMDQKWFEMIEMRKRRFDTAVWIPLRASEENETGQWGHVGFKSEFFGAASLAVPLKSRDAATNLGWHDLSLMHNHSGHASKVRYVAADEYDDKRLKGAVPLVMSQRGNSAEPPTWHIHPDFLITLGLKREGNTWVAMDEGYVEVIRMKLSEDNRPRLVEVRAEHLKDYLCARRMALRISWYRERQEIVETKPDFNWPEPDGTYKDGERWEGRVQEIHEGGEPFGASMAVMHLTRPNLDFEEDVPRIGISDEVATSSVTRKVSNKRKMYRVLGEVWRAEWVEPGKKSTRIRRDEPDSQIVFVVDAAGKTEPAKKLIGGGRWLWFKPDLVPALIERRGGSLEWYTRETGGVKGSPDSNIHFGINSLGLVNAYAKDVGYLPEWLQRVWAGFNIGPEGKVSAELFSAQGQGIPADTQAPEPFLPRGVALLNDVFSTRFGKALFRPHANLTEAFKSCHRFKALSASGLYDLAKELVRAVIEHIDTVTLQQIVSPPPKEKWGSLKSLQKVLATVIGDKQAHALMGPLHGIYNLRLADAHVPSQDLDEAYALCHVDKTVPFVMQGRDLLIACVNSLYKIAAAFK